MPAISASWQTVQNNSEGRGQIVLSRNCQEECHLLTNGAAALTLAQQCNGGMHPDIGISRFASKGHLAWLTVAGTALCPTPQPDLFLQTKVIT